MKKRFLKIKVFLLAILAISSGIISTKAITVRAVAVPPVITNENSGKEQFTKVPDGVSIVDFNSNVWNKMPEYSCNNPIVGKNINETKCIYKLMWNEEKLFFYISAKDTTWNDDDMIEIAIRYKNQNWGYLFATLAPWVGAGQFGNGKMTFVDFKKNETQGVRTIIFSADLKDKSVLKEKESLLMNVNYYDYKERLNDEKQLVCRLQSGVATSGDPCMFYPLVKSNNNNTETPDTSLYDDIYNTYEDSSKDNSENNSSSSISESNESSSIISSSNTLETDSSTISVSNDISSDSSNNQNNKSGCASNVSSLRTWVTILILFSVCLIFINKKKEEKNNE